MQKENLRKLSKEANDYVMDCELVLNDYDWMSYTLSSTVISAHNNKLSLNFKYSGTSMCTLDISYFKGKFRDKDLSIDFPSTLFEKHIKKYMVKHLEQWESNIAFSGNNMIFEFYNEIIDYYEGKLEVKDTQNEETFVDFAKLTKEEFLCAYKHITEKEYDDVLYIVNTIDKKY